MSIIQSYPTAQQSVLHFSYLILKFKLYFYTLTDMIEISSQEK